MQLQTTSICVLVLTITCFPALFYGSPLSKGMSNVQAKSSQDWDFKLYHSSQCKGSAAKFIGSGSTGCRNDVPSGGASSYYAASIASGCTVELYKDNSCSSRHRTHEVNSGASKKCTKISSKKKHINSYEVTC
ncbi:hypothetical protein N7462_001049 [Penicillium macrosclerotiorum]|uniref:uncharacterized protein n=1 Tax=Penicillium macrosclerotiorum TaxID=303699 RepID=UPI0025466F64|nr:uncharacterized protein N7462_001049 [Penicillium macrosclerotiorum]KAJ5699044.1 hypothetical protein N7462_001049 [Penicillium macrosclerotiorum]